MQRLFVWVWEDLATPQWWQSSLLTSTTQQ
jgi:hypothetical protein